jgi:hypothetical protein
MKTFAKIAALLPLFAAACGGVTNANQNSLENANQNAAESECSYTLPANADALQMHRALNAALEGEVDPCGGAVARGPSMSLSLQRVDAALNADGQRVFSMVFRVAPNAHAF